MSSYYPLVETHLIVSKHVEQVFQIQVMQPVQKRGNRARFPVIYATDGNWVFDTLKGLSYSMQCSKRDAAPFILVGIGYPHPSPLAGGVLRMRDMTFPGYPQADTTPPEIEGVLTARAGTPQYFGAEKFQSFIGLELMPFINERYATVDEKRTFFGHSLGGAFGLFTLFTKAELFNNYIVCSPALFYDGVSSAGIRYTNYDHGIQDAQRFVASGKILTDVRLYLAVGSEEEFEPECRPWQFTSGVFRLAGILKNAAIPGLNLTAEVFPQETHMTVWPMAYIHGVRTTFQERVKNE